MWRRAAQELIPVTRRWYEEAPPITAMVGCGEHRHRITWRRGKLVVEDHDVLAERSLAALGAALPVCVQVLNAWGKMRSPDMLSEYLFKETSIPPRELAFRMDRHEAETRSARDAPFRVGAVLNRPGGAARLGRIRSQAAERLEREERMWDITLIEALPPSLRRALALSVIVKVERRWHDDEFRNKHVEYVQTALADLTRPLFEQSVRRWRRNLRAHSCFTTESWALGPGAEPRCSAWIDGGGAFAALSLPVSWFIDVWARGIALVDDCLVLGVTAGTPDETTLQVVALKWEQGRRTNSKSMEAPALLTQARTGGWRLRWLPS